MYDGFEETLNTELYSVHKNLSISFTELYNMPVMYRRDMIKAHNKIVSQETQKIGR